jgi:DNA-binding response OmpR family regulator
MDAVLILLVDDDPQIQELLQVALEDDGFAVALASTSEKAIAMLDDDHASYRALITDVNLAAGNISGWDIARHARELSADMPIIYMTGASAHEWPTLGVPNSILIQKPFAVGQVTTALATLLNTGGPTPVVDS